ncbi:hypothetical protein QVD17_18861 [Tagetes erecta]|uniref:Uncharacterized protein n=1 Tax=Tagetes erecta TaxID=13708 RepID=A0AAD8NWF3_TARER|nr:hypothetical protein QVD17_18861 [Tagetes erecta]
MWYFVISLLTYDFARSDILNNFCFLKLPKTIEDLHILRDHLESYTSDYTMPALVGYCTVYIFMQTFMIQEPLFFFQDQLAKRRGGLLNYILFLR